MNSPFRYKPKTSLWFTNLKKRAGEHFKARNFTVHRRHLKRYIEKVVLKPGVSEKVLMSYR